MSQSRPKIYLSSYAKILQRALQHQVTNMPITAQEIDNPDNEMITSLEYLQSKLEMPDLYLLSTTEVQKDLSLLITKVAQLQRENYFKAVAQLVCIGSIAWFASEGITPVALLFLTLVVMECFHHLLSEELTMDPLVRDEMWRLQDHEPLSLLERPVEFLQSTVSNAVTNSFNFVASNVLYFTRGRFNLGFFAVDVPLPIRDQLKARLAPQEFSRSEDEESAPGLASIHYAHA